MSSVIGPYPDPMRDALIKCIKAEHGEDFFERVFAGGKEWELPAYQQGFEGIDWRRKDELA
jgi:hypothetical protein